MVARKTTPWDGITNNLGLEPESKLITWSGTCVLYSLKNLPLLKVTNCLLIETWEQNCYWLCFLFLCCCLGVRLNVSDQSSLCLWVNLPIFSQMIHDPSIFLLFKEAVDSVYMNVWPQTEMETSCFKITCFTEKADALIDLPNEACVIKSVANTLKALTYLNLWPQWYIWKWFIWIWWVFPPLLLMRFTALHRVTTWTQIKASATRRLTKRLCARRKTTSRLPYTSGWLETTRMWKHQ